MKKIIISLFILGLVSLWPAEVQAAGLVADHTAVSEFDQIPDYWLEKAKELTIHYAHTSHGSQINSGLRVLEDSVDSTKYSIAIRISTTEGLPPVESPPALRMYDGNPPETYINPDDYWNGQSGMDRTRAVADTGNYDFSMWSWCGQVSNAWTDIEGYLEALNQFEQEYPNMRFIYMTGHLDGTGETGALHQNNEQIREYCRNNDKVLFDFGDIGRYGPDGHDYLNEGAGARNADDCEYDGGNWCDQWCEVNSGSDLCISTSCAHSKSLNCNMKARAFWWLMARLAGWPGVNGEPTLTPIPIPTSIPTQTPNPWCQADVDVNGTVGAGDFFQVSNFWGRITDFVNNDISGDGKVNGIDLGWVIGGWGIVCK